jgi:predicted lipoprotein with Yx(FWY)xxD motif
MSRRTIGAAVVALALAAAGVATAAAVTHQSTRSGTVTLHKTKLGKVLATKSGLTLYMYKPDTKNHSNCYTGCASFWPPLMAKGKVTAGTGVKAKLLGVTKRKNGKRQVTYAGHPLYTYTGDSKAGQVKGEGYQSIWWVLDAAGKPVKHAPAGGGATTTTGYTRTTTPYGY